MFKILWKRGEIAPEEQFLLLSTIFSYLMLDFYVKTRIRFSFRNKRLFEITEFEITEVEITRVDCTYRRVQVRYIIQLYCFMVQAGFYRDVVECSPLMQGTTGLNLGWSI